MQQTRRLSDKLLLAGTVLVFASGLAACVNELLLVTGHAVAKILVASSAVGGIAAMALAWIWQRERKEFAQERARITAALNHEIRNAVQVITLANYTPDCSACKGAIQDSVVRIKAALNEHVPNEVSRGETAPLPARAARKATTGQ